MVGVIVLDSGTGLHEPAARAALATADQVLLVSDGEPATASLVAEAAENTVTPLLPAPPRVKEPVLLKVAPVRSRRSPMDPVVLMTRERVLPPESLRICALIPITRPRASNSGPPELPWLIAASVWIASTRLYCDVRESIERSVAETTPTLSELTFPNGLPIAATGWPTFTWLESPSGTASSR